MTATERAIRDSIKGGYVYVNGHREESVEWLVGLFIEEKYKTLYDPEFWRCLGIARGWDEGALSDSSYVGSPYSWMAEHQQHRLLDFLNAQKSAEDFFISLEK